MMTTDLVEDPMVLGIDLYRTDDYVRDHRIGLLPILRTVFGSILHQDLDDAQFLLTFLSVVDRRDLDGEPSMVNLRSSHGYVQVRIVRNNVLVYQHPHAVREIFGRPLQRMLAAQMPEEKHWGFGITGPGLEHMSLVRPAPRTTGSVDLQVQGDRRRLFRMEKMPEPDPPSADFAELGAGEDTVVTGSETTNVRVVFAAGVYEQFMGGMHLSNDVEEGGFLLGQLFSDRDHPDRLLVHVVEAMPAERTGASLLQFTFTGESFLRANDAIARRTTGSNELARRSPVRLVGWYHTHLFPATDRLGLSTIDEELHSRTFLQRWHVAGLVNIDDETRHLRAYGWDGNAMHQLPYRIGTAWTP